MRHELITSKQRNYVKFTDASRKEKIKVTVKAEKIIFMDTNENS